MADFLEPRTDGELKITVSQAGILRDDATVTATVYSPRATLLATDVPLTGVGGGTGAYTLAWEADWTEVAGKAVTGEYLVEVTSARAGVQRVRRFRVPVRFTDDS